MPAPALTADERARLAAAFDRDALLREPHRCASAADPALAEVQRILEGGTT